MPESFTPMSRLIIETTTSPIKPAQEIIIPAIKASYHVNGVKKEKRTAKMDMLTNAPKKPSTVLLGLTFGIIFLFPIDLPHTYC